MYLKTHLLSNGHDYIKLFNDTQSIKTHHLKFKSLCLVDHVSVVSWLWIWYQWKACLFLSLTTIPFLRIILLEDQDIWNFGKVTKIVPSVQYIKQWFLHVLLRLSCFPFGVILRVSAWLSAPAGCKEYNTWTSSRQPSANCCTDGFTASIWRIAHTR